VRDRILERVRGNYRTLLSRAAGVSDVSVLNADGGWSAVLRVPATTSEEQFALDLLERHSVVVHPGYFFDFAHEAFLVVSLLPESSTFERGIDLVLERVHAA